MATIINSDSIFGENSCPICEGPLFETNYITDDCNTFEHDGIRAELCVRRCGHAAVITVECPPLGNQGAAREFPPEGAEPGEPVENTVTGDQALEVLRQMHGDPYAWMESEAEREGVDLDTLP